MKQRKANNGLPSKYLLTIMTIVCIMLLFFNYTTSFGGGPVEAIANYIFIPMQKGIDTLGSAISLSSADTKTKEELVTENETLKQEVEDLKSQLKTYQQQISELSTLQDLYDLDQSYYDYQCTGARIISGGTSNWFNTFTINKGSKDGIEENMNVLADGGLVGIITEVGTSYSVVRTIIDDTSNVSCTISSSQDNCIVSGSLEQITTNNVVLFSNLDDADNKVSIGDIVVTSNISDKYLPGLLVGYISTIEKDKNDLTKSGTVTPVVDFKHLSDVLVIVKQKENADE